MDVEVSEKWSSVKGVLYLILSNRSFTWYIYGKKIWMDVNKNIRILVHFYAILIHNK